MNLSEKPIRMKQELSAAETLTNLNRSSSNTSPPSLPVAVAQDQTPASMPTLPFPTTQRAIVTALTLPAQQDVSCPTISGSTRRSVLEQPPPTRVKTASSSTNNSANKCQQKNFPQMLLEILETQEHSDILKWLPGGKAFIIVDKKRFGSEDLPAFLKQTQFTSFTRKLCRWKFVRVPRGPFTGAYYHKLFRRDHPALCKLMSCNDDAPSLAIIAQARQQAMDSISAPVASPRPIATGGMSVPHHNYLRILEEANRVSLIKEQLLNIRFKRAHLCEQQKGILRHTEGVSWTGPGPQLVRQQPFLDQSLLPDEQVLHNMLPHPQFRTSINDGRSTSSSSMVLQDAYFRALNSGNTAEYNAHMSQLAKLRQTGMLDRAAATRIHYMRTLQQNQVPEDNNDSQDQGAMRNSSYRASAA
eukprot:scaffold72_cov274-Chaetoceros_neogracile.AAC.14